MPRPKKFDTDQALERAIQTFWRKGYAATSVQDLLDAMGLNRGSLYATYGDKQRLFETAVARYRQSFVEPRLAALETEAAGMAEVRAFFDAFLNRARRGLGRHGCLMTNTCVELAPHDPSMAAKAQHNLGRIEQAFTHALLSAQAQGDLAPHQDPRTLGRFLTATLQGLQVLSKAGLPASHLEDVVKSAFNALK